MPTRRPLSIEAPEPMSAPAPRARCARRVLAAWLIACSAAAAAGQTAGTPPARASQNAAARAALLSLTAAQVQTHVRRTLSWYREIGSVEQLQLPGVDRSARERLQRMGLSAARLAFRFGYAAADILDREPPSAPSPKGAPPQPVNNMSAQLNQAAVSLAQRAAALNSQLAAINAQLRRARTSRARSALLTRRGELSAALDLVKQIRSNIEQMRRFEAYAPGVSKPAGLRGRLKELENTLPELETGGPQLSATAPTAAAGTASPPASGAPPAAASGPGGALSAQAARVNFRPEAAGIVALIGEWFALHRSDMQLDAALRDTSALERELQDLRTQLLGRVRSLVGGALARIGPNGPAPLGAGPAGQIEAAASHLRALSNVLVPLGDQALMLGNAHGLLDGWSSAVIAEESTVASYLGLRVGFVLALVAAVLAVSEIWRRATFRYLPDSRRRRPFLVLRRLLVGIALALIILFGLVSEVGSVATYAGFVTAGLAVALQNVILAVVAYFFLIGRFGVRVGDRITLAGVTGRVVDISLLRLYLLELSGSDLHSTGRMVVFSNAVLFQPSALFKQIPGAEYLWHSVTLTIVATADIDEAHRRLETAARQVYATYRTAIDRQHAQARRFIEFETATPEPEVRMRLTDSGLQCEVRYPVVSPETSARIDQQMLGALRAALEHDQQFQLVASGGVALNAEL